MGDGRDPILCALDRRPQLRRAVKSATINLAGTLDNWTGEYIVNEECIDILPLHPNLEEIKIGIIYNPVGWEKILTAIEGLSRLRRLIVNSSLSPGEHSLSIVREFEVHNGYSSNDMWRKPRFARRIHSFQDLGRSRTQADSMPLFSNLQELTWSPDLDSLLSICEGLSSLTRLRRLKLWTGRQNKTLGSTFPSTNLTQLVELAIRWSPFNEQDEDCTILNLIQAIAGKSRLEKLEFRCTTRKGTHFNGDKIMGHINKVHGPTLVKLKIPSFHISLATIKRLCTKSPHLQGLWLGLTPSMKTGLTSALQNSCSLRSIRIFGQGPWMFSYADALMRQTCTSLSAVKVFRKSFERGRWSNEKYKWEVVWEYDYTLECAVRRVCGPLKVLVPARRVRVPAAAGDEDQDDDYDDGEYVDQDDDMDEDDLEE
ncbi:hypothetical protein PIIN_01216 [Serendipita indica DSM 11827]|uniref:F-box domain-containing protein n=1 Tax=Serendipita indica (strain DSM 11827) TaxID=1109443 RepID=G4T7W4_SERID|nr:hypothetical protein PIIN_01216 [Serendipita indica DSM 11827]